MAEENKNSQVDENNSAPQNGQNTNNNSKQSDNSSAKRKGDKGGSKSNGDKEHSENTSSLSSSSSSSSSSSDSDSSTDVKTVYNGVKSAKKLNGVAKGLGHLTKVMNAVQHVAGALKVGTTVVVQVALAATVGIVAGLVMLFVTLFSDVSDALKESNTDIKETYVMQGAIGNTNYDANPAQLKREVARHIWTVMSGLYLTDDPNGWHKRGRADANGNFQDLGVLKVMRGLRPEQICGMLGNFEVESHIDPTAVETIFGDDYNLGPTKVYAMSQDFFTKAWGNFSGGGMTGADRMAYFNHYNTIRKCGIGLAQWTDVLDPAVDWDVKNPGRNTKLMTYAHIMGKKAFMLDSKTNSPYCSSEKWVTGTDESELMWYDLKVQLAYMTDKSEVGDSSASWLFNWADVGEEFWNGDIAINIDASTLEDNTLEGWYAPADAWSDDTGWDKSKFIIKDDMIEIDVQNEHAVGNETVGTYLYTQKENKTGGRDEYYNTPKTEYVDMVKYDDWTIENATSTAWDRTEQTSTFLPSIGKTEAEMNDNSTEDVARRYAFTYAELSADAALHGRIKYVPNPNIQNDNADTIGRDFLIENDPREYDMSAYQTPHEHTSSCYDSHGNCTCTKQWDKTSITPCEAANNRAKQKWIGMFCHLYRYHLYRYMAMYYTAQFKLEYEGNGDGSYIARSVGANEWFNEWWKAGGLNSTHWEPNLYAEQNPTMNEFGFKDYFFKNEYSYAQGVMDAHKNTIDSLPEEDKNVVIYTAPTDIANYESHRTYISNHRLSEAAALIAWPTIAQSRGNDGVKCYITIHDHVIKGDTIYQSCDRSVCTAVRWSGFDDNFPPGNVEIQEQYLYTSPRWTQVYWGGDVNQLQPGDILIRETAPLAFNSNDTSVLNMSNLTTANPEDVGRQGHIVMYIGNYAFRSYANEWATKEGFAPLDVNAYPNTVIMHGSFGERSPGMGGLYPDLQNYTAFRCTDPMAPNTSKYSSFTFK